MIRVSISPRIEHEMDTRCPAHLPVDKLTRGTVELTLAETLAVLTDARYNSDKRVFDVGEYGMPLPAFNAYRALARQIERTLTRLGFEVPA